MKSDLARHKNARTDIAIHTEPQCIVHCAPISPFRQAPHKTDKNASMRLHVVIISQLPYGANRWFVHSQILRHKTDMFDIRQLYTY